QAILKRRSIRKYTEKPVSREIIGELLKAAMSAPSAGNEQPWQFIVIDDRRVLAEIPKIHPHARMVNDAPAAILVCGDLKKEIHKGFWVQDCSAAAENILIAVSEKGLGAVWVGFYPEEDRVRAARKLLGIPEDVVPLALIPVGYPAQELPPVNRFDADRIHYNGW
ncbi:MAG: nitroreductase family protein, partial [Candidatus Omnitrophica bacterium]|nr:nitroreductase family protein [Candidatus Omnitrophota bacterium]